MSIEKTAIVKSASGLHARPGAGLVELAMTFSSDITLEKDGNKINAKEVLEVLSGNMNAGDEIKIIAKGKDEEEAASKIMEYINTTEG